MTECTEKELRYPQTFALINYWEQIAGDRPIPLRDDFDPLQVPSLLPNILIVDRHEGEYRYRLVGTRVVSIYGHDVTGWKFSRVFSMDESLYWRNSNRDPGYALSYWLGAYDKVFNRGCKVYGRDTIFWHDRDHTEFEWVALPLANKSGVIFQALVSVVFDKVGSDSIWII
jgi:hypothetical protein